METPYAYDTPDEGDIDRAEIEANHAETCDMDEDCLCGADEQASLIEGIDKGLMNAVPHSGGHVTPKNEQRLGPAFSERRNACSD